MPLYAILCDIDAAKLDLFAKHRAEHYAFLITNQPRIAFGGPARAAAGGPPETMIIIAEAASLADAQTFIAAEPYNHHGGFKKILIRPWTQILPEPTPGLLQQTLDAARKNHP